MNRLERHYIYEEVMDMVKAQSEEAVEMYMDRIEISQYIDECEDETWESLQREEDERWKMICDSVAYRLLKRGCCNLGLAFYEYLVNKNMDCYYRQPYVADY